MNIHDKYLITDIIFSRKIIITKNKEDLIFCFLSLLVFLISGSSAVSRCISRNGCDCNATNIGGCDATGFDTVRISYGSELDCDLIGHRYMVFADEPFCHLSSLSFLAVDLPTLIVCALALPNSFCN